MNHMYCYDPKQVDINKMRKDAKLRLETNVYRDKPVSTTIHHHKYGAPCNGHRHEVFEVKEEAK